MCRRFTGGRTCKGKGSNGRHRAFRASADVMPVEVERERKEGGKELLPAAAIDWEQPGVCECSADLKGQCLKAGSHLCSLEGSTEGHSCILPHFSFRDVIRCILF